MLYFCGENKSVYLSIHKHLLARRILTNVLHNSIIEKLVNVEKIVMTNGLIILAIYLSFVYAFKSFKGNYNKYE